MLPMGLVFQRFDPRVHYLDYIITIRYFGDTGLIGHYFYKYTCQEKNMKELKIYAEEPLILAHFFLSGIVWVLLLLLLLPLSLRKSTSKGPNKWQVLQQGLLQNMCCQKWRRDKRDTVVRLCATNLMIAYFEFVSITLYANN